MNNELRPLFTPRPFYRLTIDSDPEVNKLILLFIMCLNSECLIYPSLLKKSTVQTRLKSVKCATLALLPVF
jgi:hypothetical protein